MSGRGHWLWGARTDLAVFGGSAVAAVALASLAPWLADSGGGLPLWGFVVFVVAIDVAHVYSTLFRTYFDPQELRRRPALYLFVPLACLAAGVALHAHGASTFWRVLAYAAVFHFVRQQVGWVAIYRARAGERSRMDRWLDDALIYAATGWPLLYWHANLPRTFHWFMPGDFVSLPLLSSLVAPAGALFAALWVAYVVRAVKRVREGNPPNWGKHVVVVGTTVVWSYGIVFTNSDFQFSISNVVAHGVPYLALLWMVARQRAGEVPTAPLSRIVAGGFGAFVTVLLALAFVEEMLWDRLVWHDRPEVFGAAPLLADASGWLVFVVPLLAVPQTTHYVLDAVIWRRGETGPAQARALGFRGAPMTVASASSGRAIS